MSDFWSVKHPLQGGPSDPAELSKTSIEMAWKNLREGVDYVVVQWDTRQDPDYKAPTFKNAGEERAYLKANGWRCVWYWFCHRFNVWPDDDNFDKPMRKKWVLEFGFRWRADRDGDFGWHTYSTRKDAVRMMVDAQRTQANFDYRQRLRSADPAAYDAIYIDPHNVGMGEPRGMYGSAGL